MMYRLLLIAITLFPACNANALTLHKSLKADDSSPLSSNDRNAVEQLMTVREESFQEKDAEKLVNLFSENSHFVNQSGRLYWGKDANLKRHIRVFSGDYGEHLLSRTPVTSKLLKWCAYGTPAQMITIITEYQFITPQPEATIDQYDPMKPTKGIFTTILFKTNNHNSMNGWQIVSMQNTPTLPAQHNE